MYSTNDFDRKSGSPFLCKTILKCGAKGNSVNMLHRKLKELNKNGQISSNLNYFEYKSKTFGKTTSILLQEFFKSNNKITAVDAEMWQALGLSLGKTWQDIFALSASHKTGKTIEVKISGNEVMVIWRPKFIIYEYNEKSKKIRLSPKDKRFEQSVAAVLKGALSWDSSVLPNPSPLVIHGVAGNVSIQICDNNGQLYNTNSKRADFDFAATNYRDSNVAIFIGKADSAIVWDAFLWRKNKRLRIKMSYKNADASLSHRIMRTSEHEFGHVLGIFDAYGYARKADPADGHLHYGGHPWPHKALPPAHIDGTRLRRNSVMVCDYNAFDEHYGFGCCFARTNLDYEMLLFAWRDNRLQLYADSILGGKSQAYFY